MWTSTKVPYDYCWASLLPLHLKNSNINSAGQHLLSMLSKQHWAHVRAKVPLLYTAGMLAFCFHINVSPVQAQLADLTVCWSMKVLGSLSTYPQMVA
jgi:hypothetical protein